jgi:hypothetical protein
LITDDNSIEAMNFTFSKRARTISLALIILGAVGTLVGILGDHTDHHQRTWANLLVNGFFFFGISVGALFFYALQNATETAGAACVRRHLRSAAHRVAGDRRGAHRRHCPHAPHLPLDGPHPLPRVRGG